MVNNRSLVIYLFLLNLSFGKIKGIILNMNPVSILIHSGAPNDAKLFDEIMENLQKRRIIQKGDTLIFDKDITVIKTTN